jgi:metal-responsive CopG/Arc/MetJ family transcriptional regulator
MIRTVISLDPEQKAWLDNVAKERGKSMTEIVREALTHYRKRQDRGKNSTLPTLLKRTQGIWRQGDGLAWQRKLRDEWGDR